MAISLLVNSKFGKGVKGLHVVHVVESFAGGVFDFVYDLILRMPDLTHTVIHSVRRETPSDYKQIFEGKANLVRWKASREVSPLSDLKALYELIVLLKKVKLREGIDVLHLHSSKAGFLGRLAAKVLGLTDRVVYTPHSAAFLREDISRVSKHLFSFLERLAAGMGGTVVATSPSEREALASIGVNAICIPNGVDVERVRRVARDIESVSLNNARVIVGTSGRIVPQKGPEMFAEIALRVNEKLGERVEFLWIGDGPYKDPLLRAGVEVTGWLTRDDSIKILSKIDVYLSTSLWEGLSLTGLQAMALGKPLVLHDCVGNRDMVRDNGFLFITVEEAVEFIAELVQSESLRLEKGRKSLLMAQEFDINRTIKAYKELYFQVSSRV